MRFNLSSGGAMAFPATFLLFCFVVLPFLLAFMFSFTNQQFTSKNAQFLGIDNYKNILSVKTVTLHAALNENGEKVFPKMRTILRQDKEWKRAKPLYKIPFISNANKQVYIIAKDVTFWRAIINTCVFVLFVVPLQCGTALMLALLVRKKLWGRNFFRTAFFIPVVTSMVVVSIVWKFILQSDSAINQLFGLNIDWLNNSATAMLAIVVMSAWQAAGYQMLIFLAGLQSIPEERYEAAAIDGAGPWQTFLHITVPGLRNTIVFIVISTTMAAFALFVQIDVLTKGGPNDATQTLVYHAVRMGADQHKIGYASAISVIYFIIILIIAFVQKHIMDKGE